MEKHKSDPYLGKEVQKMLAAWGVETPMAIAKEVLSAKERKQQIEGDFARIMRTLNLDLNDDSLIDTPSRIAKMFLDELFWGLDYNNFPKATVVENKFGYTNMLVETNIPVKSMCEHHFIPIKGVAHVAYIPKENVIGLSKLNRIVHFFSRRPQVQERLNIQILKTLQFILNTQDVAVTISAEHLCVSHRGVEDHGTETTTTELGGAFFDKPEVRQEYLAYIKK